MSGNWTGSLNPPLLTANYLFNISSVFGAITATYTPQICFNILYVVRPSVPQRKPALEPVDAAGHNVVKEKTKPQLEEKKRTSPAPSNVSPTENGVEDKRGEQLNGDGEERGALIQPESAFSSDAKTCNTNPHLNALNADSGSHADEGPEAVVCKKEVWAYFSREGREMEQG